MKHRLHLLSLAFVTALMGCQKAPDMTPVWHTTLPATGVEITVANCTVTEMGTVHYLEYDSLLHRLELVLQEKEEDDAVPVLYAEGTPVLTITGATPEQIEVEFVYATENGYENFYSYRAEEKIDYILTEQPDGSLQYRLDTIYGFQIRVHSGETSEAIILQCHREI